MKRVLLTGASGFVGSHVLRHLLVNTDWQIVCLSSFRHRGNTDRIRLSVKDCDENFDRTTVITHDLTAPISNVLDYKIGHIDYVLNVASESHVDRSIAEPAEFIQNNVALVCNLLDWARKREQLQAFLQVSTDEVYGPAPAGYAHREWRDIYMPSNPYSASKAAQESIAFSYWRTYGVPVVITNTMNIIGEMQDTEKFVPMVIKKILSGEQIEIHASLEGVIGSRYYLHARNQADALLHILGMQMPRYGETDAPQKFHVVGEQEVNNLTLVKMIANIMKKDFDFKLVDFHSSRPGHDLRYALDGELLANTGWIAPLSLEESLERTVNWTMANKEWLAL